MILVLKGKALMLETQFNNFVRHFMNKVNKECMCLKDQLLAKDGIHYIRFEVLLKYIPFHQFCTNDIMDVVRHSQFSRLLQFPLF